MEQIVVANDCERGVISLREYIDMRISNIEAHIIASQKGMEKATEFALDAKDKATEFARISMEKRLDSMNEFRQTLSDQAALFITRDQHEALIKSIDTRLSNFTELMPTFVNRDQHDSLTKSVDGRLLNITEQTVKLVSIDKLEAYQKVVDSNVKDFHDFQIRHEAKASLGSVLFVGGISLLSLVIGVASLVLKMVGK
jgi:hypothetical protein